MQWETWEREKARVSRNGAAVATGAVNPYKVLGWAMAFCGAALNDGRDPRQIKVGEIIAAFDKAFGK
jgi:hypothetical protein